MTGGWYTAGSTRERVGSGGYGVDGGGDDSGVGAAGASGAGGGASAGLLAPNNAGTPAPAERTAQVQGKAPGLRVAQRVTPGPRAARPEVRGPRAARPEVRGPRSAQQGSPGTVPVYRENLQGKDRQVTMAEPPGQSKTVNPTRGQEKVWKR